jgi:hypothetical protein
MSVLLPFTFPVDLYSSSLFEPSYLKVMVLVSLVEGVIWRALISRSPLELLFKPQSIYFWQDTRIAIKATAAMSTLFIKSLLLNFK